MNNRQTVFRNLFGGEDMENYLTDLIRDMIPNYVVEPNRMNSTRQEPRTRPNYTIPQNNNIHSENFLNENIFVTEVLREIMSNYNTNMRNYQDNIRVCLEIVDSLEHHNSLHRRSVFEDLRQRNGPGMRAPEQQRPTNTTIPQGRPSANPLVWNTYTYPILPTSRETIFNRTIRATIPTNFQDVIVRPTYEEVLNATQDILFNRQNDNLNTSCPITLEEFRNGDLLTQIRQCGHIFSQSAIQNWFSRNVRCPVCRYDIRTRLSRDISGNTPADLSGNLIEEDGSSEDEELENNNQENGSPDDVEELINTLTDNISNIIQNYVNSTDLSNVTRTGLETNVYSFEIPLNFYTDSSGGLIVN